MKETQSTDTQTAPVRSNGSALTPSDAKAPYVKPRVEPAGSVFSRTQALGGGSKDGLSGSTLL